MKTYLLLEKLFDSGNFVYLTDCTGELIEGFLPTEDVYEWYMSVPNSSGLPIYLAQHKGEPCIVVKAEFNQDYAADWDMTMPEMRDSMRAIAGKLSNAPELQGLPVYLGIETGVNDCDEIAIIVPYGTDPALVDTVAVFVDKTAYKD